MQDHLPECHYTVDTGNIQYGWNDCICDALRSCEQRAFEKGWDEGEEVGYDRGRTSGLMSAEAAVADIDGEEMCCACNDDYRMTIAAIRALKEKP